MSVAESEILSPGTRIRPEVDDEEVRRMAERLYGIIVKEICELLSYDDRNFLIHPDRNVKNPLISHNCPDGYVMKVLNSLDSHKVGFVDAQTKMMLYLGEKNIKCPVPVKNVYGNYFSVETIGPQKHKHVVRVLEYMSGKIFHEVPTTDHLIYQAGVFVAKFDNALKNFEHDAYRTHKSLWMLESVPKLKEFLYALKDESKLDIVEQVIEKFTKTVLDKDDTFQKGIIHGDFNEQNIVLNKQQNQYRVSGVLDFGDTCHTNLVYEVAIAMTYMMIQTKKLESGGVFIAGYTSTRIIPPHEMDVLRVCIAARLCQSLVMGTYTHSLDPSNDYLLTTQKTGWELLHEIWSKKDEEVRQLWVETADEYLKSSNK